MVSRKGVKCTKNVRRNVIVKPKKINLAWDHKQYGSELNWSKWKEHIKELNHDHCISLRENIVYKNNFMI